MPTSNTTGTTYAGNSQVVNYYLGNAPVKYVYQGNNIVYENSSPGPTPPVDYSTQYFTLSALSAGNICWSSYDGNDGGPINAVISYSKNDGAWTDITAATDNSTTISVSAGDKVRFKGLNATYGSAKSNNNFGNSTADMIAYGNIMSLIYGDNFTGQTTLASAYTFSNLFRAANVYVAENIVLPATTLADGCYNYMFYGAPIITGPELPATTLAVKCYQYMFSGCTNLTAATTSISATTIPSQCCQYMFANCSNLATAPALPATTIGEYGYRNMFINCRSFTTAPALPATTLANSCYYSMFAGCSNLTTAPALLPATTLRNTCYRGMFSGTSITIAPVMAPTTVGTSACTAMFADCTGLTNISNISLPATSLNPSCYNGMFKGCTSLTTTPALPATTLANGCYTGMFSGCTSLTRGPVLPAATIPSSGYSGMFSGCISLTAITCLATSITATNCTSMWVNGVNTTGGVFTCASGMENTWSVGKNGVPTKWVIQPPVEYFTITNRTATPGTITIKRGNTPAPNLVLKTTTDGTNWNVVNVDSASTATTISLPANGYVKFDGTSNKVDSWAKVGMYWQISCNVAHDISGDIMTLVSGDTLTSSGTFNSLFSGDTALVNASGLTLSSTALTNYAYYNMFSNCTNLVSAPALPATTLAQNCYLQMFTWCTSLATAPVMSATTLATGCCQAMFQECRNLTDAPVLNASMLVDNCYAYMFQGCRNLTAITCLATDISATGCTDRWVNNVNTTGGTFTCSPGMTAVWTTGASGVPTNWTIQPSDLDNKNCDDYAYWGYESYEECDCAEYGENCPDPCDDWEGNGYSSYEDCTCQNYGENCPEEPEE